MTVTANRPRGWARLRLRHLLFGFLLLFGVLPLLFSSAVSLGRNRDLLEREEKVNLSRQAEQLSERLGLNLEIVVRQLEQLGSGLVAMPRDGTGSSQAWLQDYLSGFAAATQGEFASRVTFLETGESYGSAVPDDLGRALRVAGEGAGKGLAEKRSPAYDFFAAVAGEPWVVISLRISDADGPSGILLQGARPLPLDAKEGQGVFLLDVAAGRVLWADRGQATLVRQAVERAAPVREALRSPAGAYPVFEYEMRVGSSQRAVIGQFGKIGNTGWVVLVQKHKEAALRAVSDLVRNVVLTAAVTVALALVSGAAATRLLSLPIQRLAESSLEIADGRFGRRVEVRGAGREIIELASSFNRMSAQVQDHVARLKGAAQVNRELFIGTIRALLAAVEAKEPYTRGHSERVASYSQAIATEMTDERERADQVWLAGLLHDIGKIGIDDRVLNKGEVLTAEEFEAMKRHPVIGAEIMASIDQLKTVLPAIRWHHERWEGGGYPDGLVGDQIPMMARIVAVADTFDAVTTQRAYQDPHTPEQAVELIRELEGRSFDARVVAAFVVAYGRGGILVPSSGSYRQQRRTVALEDAVVHT